jgi:hypothetical protein
MDSFDENDLTPKFPRRRSSTSDRRSKKFMKLPMTCSPTFVPRAGSFEIAAKRKRPVSIIKELLSNVVNGGTLQAAPMH